MKKLLVMLLFTGVALAQGPSETKSVTVVEGCLKQDGGDFLLVASGGGTTHLLTANTKELAAHVGQRLRVRGTEETRPAAASQQAVVNGTQPPTPVEKEPVPGTQPSGTPDPKVSVTQLPQSAQAGDGTEGFRGNPANRELRVDHIEMLGGSCKAAAGAKSKGKR